MPKWFRLAHSPYALYNPTSMDFEYTTLVTFILITTFTPGPNNISSASMGLNFGYRRTFPYLLGIYSGFVIIMGLCALVAGLLSDTMPRIQRYLAWVGAIYILYLAYHTFRASYRFKEGEQAILGFGQGALLQLFNPKVIIYGLTLYTGFLHDIVVSPYQKVGSAFLFALMSLISTSTWTLFGSGIRELFHHEGARLVVNSVLSLLLVATAVQISGIIPGF